MSESVVAVRVLLPEPAVGRCRACLVHLLKQQAVLPFEALSPRPVQSVWSGLPEVPGLLFRGYDVDVHYCLSCLDRAMSDARQHFKVPRLDVPTESI